jgi:uncharacterized protein (DUF2164 family)
MPPQRRITPPGAMIRQAVVDYLRQYDLATSGLEPEVALKVLRRRLGMAYLNKTLKN